MKPLSYVNNVYYYIIFLPCANETATEGIGLRELRELYYTHYSLINTVNKKNYCYL